MKIYHTRLDPASSDGQCFLPSIYYYEGEVDSLEDYVNEFVADDRWKVVEGVVVNNLPPGPTIIIRGQYPDEPPILAAFTAEPRATE